MPGVCLFRCHDSDNVFKIGKTRRDLTSYLGKSYHTVKPLRAFETEDADEMEQVLLDKFKECFERHENGREWFVAEEREITRKFENICIAYDAVEFVIPDSDVPDRTEEIRTENDAKDAPTDMQYAELVRHDAMLGPHAMSDEEHDNLLLMFLQQIQKNKTQETAASMIIRFT